MSTMLEQLDRARMYFADAVDMAFEDRISGDYMGDETTDEWGWYEDAEEAFVEEFGEDAEDAERE